jgi:hypothetical protein
MYLNPELVKKAMNAIKDIHPFYGINFLAAKLARLPIGKTIEVSLDGQVREFMDRYFKPYEASKYYYRYYTPPKDDKWWPPKYPGSTSQSTRTRGRLSKSFIHDTARPRLWGWQLDYIQIIKDELKGKKIRLFYLAVWILREYVWDEDTTPEDVVSTFIQEFYISQDEVDHLFDVTIPEDVENYGLLSSKAIRVQDLVPIIGLPPDLPEERGGILSFLQLDGVGPADSLVFEPGRRVNLVTGDNGLGKTFLLDISWWALTGEWADLPADPTGNQAEKAAITFQISGEYTESTRITVRYDSSTFSWPVPTENRAIPSLLVYARADNSFAIWDPAQHQQPTTRQALTSKAFFFSPKDVWFGLEDPQSRHSICEGLLRDWVTWQNMKAVEFEMLTRVLERLSPIDIGYLVPGSPTRVPGEKRLMPTLSLPYGDVAVIYVSEGMKRVISLAYLLVWAWSEHKTASKLANIDPQPRMVILLDELEAHLHPKWQRLILPALIDVQAELSKELEVQFVIATHSPLVMASIEPIYDAALDKLFNLDLTDQGWFRKKVELKELPFVKFGAVDAWLTSDFFELQQPRSTAAEEAIENAKQIQLEDHPEPSTVQEIHNRLVRYLSADDEFWPRWLFFAESHGVTT